jgi:glycosyltransferase involved in cell wall biosynthesis
VSAAVALLGNMNNGHFALARYLRDRHVDAHVLLFDNEQPQFHPSNDTYDDGYLKFVHQLHWGSSWGLPFTPSKRVKQDLGRYDVLIGCGTAPAYCDKAGRRLDVFVPFGGDIWAMLGKSEGNPLRLAKYAPLIRAQGRGIGNSAVFHMAPTNAAYEGQWTKYRGASVRWYEGVPGVYDVDYRPQKVSAITRNSAWAEEFRTARDAADLMLFSSARHFWKCSPNHPAAKGTDRLLRGIALFRDRHPECRLILATLEYGLHVAESKALVRELRIEENVKWYPMMPRKDLMAGLAMADIACAEFENSWIASGVLYEAMALGKPILAHRVDSLYQASQPDLYEIMNAKEPVAIADRLEAYWRDPNAFKAMGERGRDWYRTWVVAKPLDKYVALIRARDGDRSRTIGRELAERDPVP